MLYPPTPIERPTRATTDARAKLVESDRLVGASAARKAFRVDGAMTTIAVVDSGLNSGHLDFAGRILWGRNFTREGVPEDFSDGYGHGTNVTGIIAANAIHVGIAPGCSIVSLKIFDKNGQSSFEILESALDWLLANERRFGITAICLSLSDSGNYVSDKEFLQASVAIKLREFFDRKIPIVAAAGNLYKVHGSKQGMSFPAILFGLISAGAVFDGNIGRIRYPMFGDAKAFSTEADRVTPFSQRLHESVGGRFGTTIFGPGAPVTSTGIDGDAGSSTQHGTSQAAPVVAGAILLFQDYWLKRTGVLPDIGQIVDWLMKGAADIVDGDDEDDDVDHACLHFKRLDILNSLRHVSLG
jgi:subtilisin family serine protease